jgi:hypothetical protein
MSSPIPSLGEVLAKREVVGKNPRALKHEWQAFAYKVWKEYSGIKRELPNVVRHFKKYNDKYRGYLDSAYSFCKDYEGPVPKMKLFYWKFWELYKGRG